MFVGHTTDAINKALGLTTEAEGQDPEAESYREVAIRSDVARRVKLISTTRSQERILYRHSCAVEDSLGLGTTAPLIDTGAFANCRIEDVPHLMFPFDPLPKTKFEELTIEFPHYRTRSNREVLDMFRVAPDVFA
jgi:hypothetical protein